MNYSIKEIQQIVKGTFLNETPEDQPIERLLFDSRHLVFANRTLFFAFTGDRQDGHLFIEELYDQGVRNFVVTKENISVRFRQANFILVADSIRALQKLAKYHRQRFKLPIIGITGSNGKTIIKEWLFQLLHQDYRIVKNPGSYNSQIGVPLSIWLIEANHNLGLFEAGISRPKEMKKLAPIIDCTIGVFTNIGTAHSEGFASQKKKIKEKLKLFKNTETIIYCRDHDLVDELIQELPKKKYFTWAYHKKADLRIESIEVLDNEVAVRAIFKKERYFFTLPFADKASIENGLHCYAVLLYLGFSPSQIKVKIAQLESIPMRLEVKVGIHGSTLINDSYNSDLTSIEYALNFAAKRDDGKQFILILSDILQSGESAKRLYQKITQLLIAKKVDRLVAIGQDIRLIKDLLPLSFPVQYYRDTSAFLTAMTPSEFYNSKVLLKGARIFQFERILRKFEEKAHKTVLEVNLSAIAHNLKVYGQFLQPNTQLIAMVKASAYGSGSIEVAKLLAFYKVNYLAVAYADEGVELRKAGIHLPILVLNPEEASFDSLVAFDLEPEIYSIRLLQQFINFIDSNKEHYIHLKLDTGMHRLGFEEKDIPILINLLTTHSKIVVKSIFSHLAASDMEEHDAFTSEQIAQFNELSASITQYLPYQPLRHILNSSGIVRFPQYQFDMVRLGIGLYGIDGGENIQSQLKVVNTLKATISQIKEVVKNDTVGYNRSGKISRYKKIATITIGYADGLSRKAGNGNYHVVVKNQSAPIIGNVCMDMCMIDISEIPTAQVGDEVVIFGESPRVERLAECLETIPYELFTSVSNRVKRIYYRE